MQGQRQRGADAGPLQHGQQETVHEDPRQHRQRDRKRSVFGGEQHRQRGQMHGNDQAGQRKEAGAARFRGGLSLIPGSATADMARPQRPLMNPASINNRLNLRASAPSLQA